MRAVVYRRYGPPDVLELQEIAKPRPAEGEVLTTERLTQDGIEVARYATRRLGKRKVILMGGSWGSALAVNMAMAAPGLFHAYVGTAQFVNYQKDMSASYANTLKLAQTAGDVDAVAKLHKIGSPHGATHIISES